LLLEPVDRVLTGPQIPRFGVRSDSKPKEFVSALNDLEWLPEIVPGYGEQHPFKIRDCVGLRNGRHSPGCWLRNTTAVRQLLARAWRHNGFVYRAHREFSQLPKTSSEAVIPPRTFGSNLKKAEEARGFLLCPLG
jgi:hypothetical protein